MHYKYFFSEINKEYNPFGIGPWPCLNHAAEHYRENVIDNVKITEDSKTRKPVGTFDCDCGYCYSRTGPDQFDNDRFRKGRVKRFGYLWESKLLELLKEKDTSYRQMALQLGCDLKTVQKFEKQYRESNNLITIKSFSKVDQELHDKTSVIYKMNLQKILKTHPEISRTELRKLCQKEYLRICISTKKNGCLVSYQLQKLVQEVKIILIGSNVIVRFL